MLTVALLVGVFYSIALAAQPGQAAGQDYVIQSGDTLYRLAEQFYGNGNSWPMILEATNVKAQTDSSYDTITDTRRLRVGQKVWIPAQAGEESSPGSQAAPTLVPTAAVQAAAATAALRQAVETQPGVRFVTPANDATVPPTVTVEMTATGLVVEPAGEIREGAGHMHILVDTDFVPPGEIILTDAQHLHFGKGQLTTTLALEPGMHVLRLQFANGAHIALEGEEYQDEITVTVAE
jgi:LysM repeat protein